MSQSNPDLLKEQGIFCKEKGLDLKKLKEGTHLRIETHNSVYKIILDKVSTVEGGTRRSGVDRFPEPVPAFSLGSTTAVGGDIKLDWIAHGMHLEIQVSDGRVVTSPVENVVVGAEDDSWSYSLDWNT